MKKYIFTVLAVLVMGIFVARVVSWDSLMSPDRGGDAAVEASPQGPIPHSVDLYAEAYQQALQNSQIPLEKVYALGMTAMNEIAEVLNSLSETELKTAREKMPGFFLNPHNESIIINPLPDVFLDLAKTKGTPVDVSFFLLEKKQSPEGLWPAYFEQHADLTGCTRYDGTLTELYGEWMEFQRVHPSVYGWKIQQHLEEIQSEFTDTRCACKDAEGMIKEFKSFLGLKPKLAPETLNFLKERLQSIEAGTSDIQFNCRAAG